MFSFFAPNSGRAIVTERCVLRDSCGPPDYGEANNKHLDSEDTVQSDLSS